ncbi:unnamed protein product [Trichobilharzia regenti]|nr:unnamed protein product [Trichobilharzia regenti]
MKRRQSELTHNLIVFALQRTLSFETSLNKTYTSDAIEALKSKIVNSKNVERSLNPFDDDDDDDGGVGDNDDGSGEVQSKESREDKTDLPVTDDSTNSWKMQIFDGIISR